MKYKMKHPSGHICSVSEEHLRTAIQQYGFVPLQVVPEMVETVSQDKTFAELERFKKQDLIGYAMARDLKVNAEMTKQEILSVICKSAELQEDSE